MEKIKDAIGGGFTVDYDSIISHKYVHKSRIRVKCDKCAEWSMIGVEALIKRRKKRIGYTCRRCSLILKMNTPEMKKQCSKRSKELWDNKRDMMVNKIRKNNKREDYRENMSNTMKKIKSDNLSQELDKILDDNWNVKDIHI